MPQRRISKITEAAGSDFPAAAYIECAFRIGRRTSRNKAVGNQNAGKPRIPALFHPADCSLISLSKPPNRIVLKNGPGLGRLKIGQQNT